MIKEKLLLLLPLLLTTSKGEKWMPSKAENKERRSRNQGLSKRTVSYLSNSQIFRTIWVLQLYIQSPHGRLQTHTLKRMNEKETTYSGNVTYKKRNPISIASYRTFSVENANCYMYTYLFNLDPT